MFFDYTLMKTGNKFAQIKRKVKKEEFDLHRDVYMSATEGHTNRRIGLYFFNYFIIFFYYYY
uniref:Photosystem II CP47 chlorophyll apoprotein n=1 Tax=Bridelia tomentosa TaxID=300990 RepID=A0A8E6ZB35_9ROSI|nr:photosystem II CP47 chlorophyll apoprotein [Bridelia tomentosa]